MTATERLCELLDERGIEWWSVESLDKVPLTVCVIDDVRYKFRPQGRGIIVSSCTEGTVTPEQAIAATVGVGTCVTCPEMDNPDSFITHLIRSLEYEKPIRCHECTNYEQDTYGIGGVCHWFNRGMAENDWCSRAERRVTE